MDTEVFLQKTLQRKEFHGAETTEFLFNCYEILNILNYNLLNLFIRHTGSDHLSAFYTCLYSVGKRKQKGTCRPRYSIFFLLAPLQLQMFLQTLQLPKEPGSWAHRTQRQKHKCFFAWLQNNSRTRNWFSPPLLICHLSPKIITELENKFLQIAQKSFKKQKAFLKVHD